MSEAKTAKQQRAVDTFRHNYLSILEKSSIPAKARRWYKTHVETYIAAHQAVKLKHHRPAAIDEYLIAKGRLKQLQEWQFRLVSTHCVWRFAS